MGRTNGTKHEEGPLDGPAEARVEGLESSLAELVEAAAAPPGPGRPARSPLEGFLQENEQSLRDVRIQDDPARKLYRPLALVRGVALPEQKDYFLTRAYNVKNIGISASCVRIIPVNRHLSFPLAATPCLSPSAHESVLGRLHPCPWEAYFDTVIWIGRPAVPGQRIHEVPHPGCTVRIP